MTAKRKRRQAATAESTNSPRGTRTPPRGTRTTGPREKRGPRRTMSPPPDDADDPSLLSWAEVSRTHRVRNGVYQREGRLVSLLTDFGRLNPCYPDRRAEGDPETIHYTGAGRRGDQHLTPANRALLDAIRTSHAVPLFNKLAPGRWQHAGLWRVAAARHEFDEGEQRMLWRFTLKKVKGSG